MLRGSIASILKIRFRRQSITIAVMLRATLAGPSFGTGIFCKAEKVVETEGCGFPCKRVNSSSAARARSSALPYW